MRTLNPPSCSTTDLGRLICWNATFGGVATRAGCHRSHRERLEDVVRDGRLSEIFRNGSQEVLCFGVVQTHLVRSDGDKQTPFVRFLGHL